MTTQKELRRKILKNRGVELAKHTRKPRTHDEIPTVYHKTQLMKYIELKHHADIKSLIMEGNIYKLEKKLSIDATTISKWRKAILKAEEDAFWAQFPNTEKGE